MDDDRAAAPRSGRRLVVGSVVLALLAGGLAGHLLGRGTADAPSPVVAPATPPAMTATPSTPTGPPSRCAGVTETGNALLAALERAVRDPGELRRVVDEIERLRDELRAEVAACEAPGGAPTASPIPR